MAFSLEGVDMQQKAAVTWPVGPTCGGTEVAEERRGQTRDSLSPGSSVWTIGSGELPKIFEENIVIKGVFKNEIFSTFPKAEMAVDMFA